VAQRRAISPVRCSRSARRWTAGPGAVGPPRLRDFGQGAAGVVALGALGVPPAFVAGQRVGGVRAADHDQFGGEPAEPLDLLHAPDGLAGVHGTRRRTVQQPMRAASATARRHSLLRPGRSRSARAGARGGGYAPSWLWRAISSARSRADCTMRSRCTSTDHADGIVGEWKPHGRSPGSRSCTSPITGSRRPASGQPRPSTSNARNRRACAAAASRSPSPASATCAVSLAWVTSLRRGASHPRRRTPCAAPARTARPPATRG
jgi:hypothetical protein